jgi:hypothetical protein
MKRAAKIPVYILFITIIFNSCAVNNSGNKASVGARAIWTEEKANTWYNSQPWYVGANFLPSTAINQLEMFRGDSFDPATIDREFGYAKSLGMNVMRVYLHDLMYTNDAKGFKNRLNKVLELAARHRIKLLLTIFDSCWDPYPVWGVQRAPKPFLHNSGWVQSPGKEIIMDEAKFAKMESYVKWLMKNFGNDDHVLAWDVWNEPDNMNNPAYVKQELVNKAEYILPLLKKTFEWARAGNPSQPLTSGVWAGNWASDNDLRPIERVQIEESDIISFHCYDKPSDFENKIKHLQRYNRPIICTEYMARPNGSTFQGFLPIAKKYKVGMINWGFVDGKSQTIYPWDSWTKTYTGEPPLWFHDIFRRNGTPYKKEETDFIKAIINK